MQERLDIPADALFRNALGEANLRWHAREGQDAPWQCSRTGAFALAIYPLDGSSNIDTNVLIGTILAVYPAKDRSDASFLRPAGDLIAGGYVISGPRCCLVISFGDGTQIYTLNPHTDSFDRSTRQPAGLLLRIRHQRVQLSSLPRLDRRLTGRGRQPATAEFQHALGSPARWPMRIGF